MSDYNLIMIATHQDDSCIKCLIDSIQDNNKKIKVLLLVISQECEINCESRNSSLTIRRINEVKMSLSKARNIGIKYLSDQKISSEYIMFPDDDSSFDEVFFNNFRSILGSDKCYLTSIYNTGSKDLFFDRKLKENTTVKITDNQLIGSPNQIILYDKLKHKILFNEELGVGARYGSSEDLDLFLKINTNANSYFFTDRLYSFHPKKTAAHDNVKFSQIINRFRNYSTGFVYVVFKYKMFRFIPELFIRTLAAFVIFFFKGKFKLSFAYLFQFFIRIQILIYFLFNKPVCEERKIAKSNLNLRN